MERTLDRKSFVTTLGAAGLGLGMAVAGLGGAPGARAQEGESTPAGGAAPARDRFDQIQTELYAAFTAALAEELGSGDAAQVDSGIRAALATVVDGFAGDDLVTSGQATALKALIETAEVPLGPGPLLGHERYRAVRVVGPAGELPTDDVTITAVEGEPATDGRQAMAERFYPDFTAALATELGAGSADEVDGAIRLAMMTVIDGLESDDLPMPIPADALKTMVATAESPLAPEFLFGAHPGMSMRGFHGRGDDGHGFHGRGRGDDEWFDDREEIREEAVDDDAATDDENDDSEDETSG
jgi:hypothetical protein